MFSVWQLSAQPGYNTPCTLYTNNTPVCVRAALVALPTAAIVMRMPQRRDLSLRNFLRRKGMCETEVNKPVWNAGAA